MESITNYMPFNIAGSGVGEQLVPGVDEFREELTDKERIENPTITLGEVDSLKLD